MTSAIDFLYGLNPKRIKFGLDATYHFLDHIGRLQPKAKIIHIAGTNGKGTTCITLHRILKENGYKVGLFTSPHIHLFNERIRIGDDLIQDDFIESFIDKHRDYIADHDLTFFEVNTILAVDYFEANQCEYIILETGMGGRLDSTNCFNPIITAITNVSIDHQNYLGEHIDDIIKEKCGIIKKGVPLYSVESNNKIYHKIYCEALDREAGSLYRFTHRSSAFKRIKKIIGPNHPTYRYLNMALAYKIAEFLLDERLHKKLDYLNEISWPGRLQIIQNNLILDVSHNQAGVSETISYLKQNYRGSTFTILTAISYDKDIKSIFEWFSSLSNQVYIYPMQHQRMNTDELFEIVAHFDLGVQMLSHKANLEELIAQFNTDYILVIGSHFLLEDFHKRYL